MHHVRTWIRKVLPERWSSFPKPLSRHEFTLRDHGYGASASRGVPVYAPAFAGNRNRRRLTSFIRRQRPSHTAVTYRTPVCQKRITLHTTSYFHGPLMQIRSRHQLPDENPATAVRIPGRATIPLSSNIGQVVYTHCLPSFSAPINWGYKREFSAPKWLWWLSALD